MSQLPEAQTAKSKKSDIPTRTTTSSAPIVGAGWMVFVFFRLDNFTGLRHGPPFQTASLILLIAVVLFGRLSRL